LLATKNADIVSAHKETGQETNIKSTAKIVGKLQKANALMLGKQTYEFRVS
jgi:hypothetical protein